jgi:hypothetical protein
MNPEMWVHLENDDCGNLLIFLTHPDEIKMCFNEKKMCNESKADFHHILVFQLMGKSRYENVEETLKNLKVEFPELRNIDDYFRKVTLFSDREYMGWKLPNGTFMGAITC